MVNVGPLEILLVAIIALIVLGPQRLPEVARSVGRGMREFRTALTDPGHDDEDADDDEDQDEDDLDPDDEDEVEQTPAEELPEGR